jgi:hypothetical protein
MSGRIENPKLILSAFCHPVLGSIQSRQARKAHTRQSRRSFMKTISLIVCVLVFAFCATAQNTHVDIFINGVSWGGTPYSKPDTVFTESAYTILVTVNPTTADTTLEFHGLQFENPEWLNISITEIDASGELHTLPSDLQDKMKTFYYVESTSIMYDSLYASGNDIGSNRLGLLYPDYTFYIEIPRELFGRMLEVSANLDPPPFGMLAQDDPFGKTALQMYVQSPATKEDSAKALLSKSRSLLETRRYQDCMTFVDSAIDLGFFNLADHGLIAATKSSSFEKAIVYLDTMYNNFGTTILQKRWDDQTQAERDARYQERREELVSQLK